MTEKTPIRAMMTCWIVIASVERGFQFFDLSRSYFNITETYPTEELFEEMCRELRDCGCYDEEEERFVITEELLARYW